MTLAGALPACRSEPGMLRQLFLSALWVALATLTSAAERRPRPEPAPRTQAVPLPSDQVSCQRDGFELARYHFGATLRRPFVIPVIGPSSRPCTRMGQPHDPVTHSHHNSVWISHNDANGVSFWDEFAKTKLFELGPKAK